MLASGKRDVSASPSSHEKNAPHIPLSHKIDHPNLAMRDIISGLDGKVIGERVGAEREAP